MTTSSDTVLVIVDVQSRLANAMDERPALFDNLAILIQGAKLLEIPIIWAEQNPSKLGPTDPDISQYLGDQSPIAKMSFSCFQEPNFCRALKETQREHVLVCGIETHICVYQTVRDLFEAEYFVEVVADATSSRAGYQKEIALSRLSQSGVKITTVETALFDLMKTAEHPQFRAVQALLK